MGTHGDSLVERLWWSRRLLGAFGVELGELAGVGGARGHPLATSWSRGLGGATDLRRGSLGASRFSGSLFLSLFFSGWRGECPGTECRRFYPLVRCLWAEIGAAMFMFGHSPALGLYHVLVNLFVVPFISECFRVPVCPF